MNAYAPFLSELCLGSRRITLEHYESKDLIVDQKGDTSLVTSADRNCEEFLRAAIRKRFPDHGVIGEEFGEERSDAQIVWTIDPIDGTASFVHGIPLFTTLIGVLENGVPIAGAIYQPFLERLCIGTASGTILNGARCQVSRINTLGLGTVVASGISGVGGILPKENSERLIAACRLFRTWGDGWGYMMVASGRAEVMLDGALKIWDAVPVIPVINGAGGKATSIGGGDPLNELNLVATNAVLHDEVLRLLRTSAR